jgi:thiamine-monophosphate kinase
MADSRHAYTTHQNIVYFCAMVKNKESGAVTALSELGEFGLIRHLTSAIRPQQPDTLTGIGDDAAVLHFDKTEAVVSTDMLVEGVHFDLLYTPIKHLGYKAVVVNLSDIYAMNAKPKQITVAIAASNRISVELLEELYEGILLACNTYNVDLVGGDTTSSSSGLILSITAIGEAKKEKLVYRNGAKENNLVCVSGNLGAAYMGLQLLEREKQIYNENPDIQPDLSGYDYLLERQLKPEARKGIVELLEKKGVLPTAMIDISDGLASEMLHLCEQSGVGCNIYETKLPIDPVTVSLCNEMNMIPSVCALNGGEDYELLFTINAEDYEKIQDEDFISVVGHITSEGAGKFLITTDDKAFELKAQGWDALKKGED